MWWYDSGMSIIIHSSLQYGRSLLMLAYGNVYAMKILVSAGADVNHQNKVSSTSPAQ